MAKIGIKKQPFWSVLSHCSWRPRRASNPRRDWESVNYVWKISTLISSRRYSLFFNMSLDFYWHQENVNADGTV